MWKKSLGSFQLRKINYISNKSNIIKNKVIEAHEEDSEILNSVLGAAK